ncbi:MAG: flagellar hook-length control protein FliK [Firmicutes bacterium]|nr:flagellar hook-length control protein FliK [Bacillota bacterium]
MDISSVTPMVDTPPETQMSATGGKTEATGGRFETVGLEFLSLLKSLISDPLGCSKEEGALEGQPQKEEKQPEPTVSCMAGIGLPLQEGFILTEYEDAEEVNPLGPVAEYNGAGQNTLVSEGRALPDAGEISVDILPDSFKTDDGKTVGIRDGQGEDERHLSVGNKEPPDSSSGLKPAGGTAKDRDDVIGNIVAEDNNPEANKEEAFGLKPTNTGDTSKNQGQYRDGPKLEATERETAEKPPAANQRDAQAQPLAGTGQAYRSQGLNSRKNTPDTAASDIVNQVADKMKVMLGKRRSEVSIQLKPESLGRLKVSITITDGVLNGRITVQSDETKGIIQANILKLQENLEGQGIPVGKFHVDVGGGYNQQQFFDQNRQSHHGRHSLNRYQEEENVEYAIWRGEGTIELLA